MINKALIALARQYQALENIKLELELFKDDDVRHIRIGRPELPRIDLSISK